MFSVMTFLQSVYLYTCLPLPALSYLEHIWKLSAVVSLLAFIRPVSEREYLPLLELGEFLYAYGIQFFLFYSIPAFNVGRKKEVSQKLNDLQLYPMKKEPDASGSLRCNPKMSTAIPN